MIDMNNVAETLFIERMADRGFALSELQLNQFQKYYHMLVEWNEKINLTAITDILEVYSKHFFDSASVSFFIDLNSMENLADIGSGAGFPGIPLKILFPHLQLTIVDSLKKRISFLESLIKELEISNVHCVHGRAEDVARMKQYRDQFDMVTARAVARLTILNELCLPFVKVNGIFIALKGSGFQEELRESMNSFQQLRGSHETTHEHQLPEDESFRSLIVVRKRAATPAMYPRKAGTPLKQPL